MTTNINDKYPMRPVLTILTLYTLRDRESSRPVCDLDINPGTPSLHMAYFENDRENKKSND